MRLVFLVLFSLAQSSVIQSEVPDLMNTNAVSHVQFQTGQPSITVQSGSVSLLAPDSFPSIEEIITKKGIVAKFKVIAPKILKQGLNVVGKLGIVAVLALSLAALGIGFTEAVCTYINLCSLKFTALGYENEHLQEAVRAYMTPDKLSSLTDFVLNSIQKYTKKKRNSKTED